VCKRVSHAGSDEANGVCVCVIEREKGEEREPARERERARYRESLSGTYRERWKGYAGARPDLVPVGSDQLGVPLLERVQIPHQTDLLAVSGVDTAPGYEKSMAPVSVDSVER